MATYSKSDKLLHKIYLSNYFISGSTLELENILYGSKAEKHKVDQFVFVSGLARSGTTAVMREIFNSGMYASLQYSNMPFLLAPNLWKRSAKIEAHQRAHGDGIMIDGNSPEEFDEYFWKASLRDNYISENGLIPHEVSADILKKYRQYIQLICLSKGKNRYISKNNNNILRFDVLRELEDSLFIFLFREPVSHASSLLKLHKSFSESQKKDSFELDYFNYLGHHEFGLGHKPFLFKDDFPDKIKHLSRESLDYWLLVWIQYYEHLLTKLSEKCFLICFEDLISHPDVIYSHIWKVLSIESRPPKLEPHIPSNYTNKNVDPVIFEQAESLYKQLLSKKV